MPSSRRCRDSRQPARKHYRDMQDIEFTIQQGKLWMLQTRTGKRTGARRGAHRRRHGRRGPDRRARKAMMRVEPTHLDQLLHPIFDPRVESAQGRVLAKGLNASPGAASGRIVFTPTTRRRGRARREGHPRAHRDRARRTSTACRRAGHPHRARRHDEPRRGGRARMGKVCVAGCGEIEIDYGKRVPCGRLVTSEGDWISIDGTTGEVIAGEMATQLDALFVTPSPRASGRFSHAPDEVGRRGPRELGVRANADTRPGRESRVEFGAEGIGLCRTEHMFFDPTARSWRARDDPRRDDGRGSARARWRSCCRCSAPTSPDLRAMDGLPVTIRCSIRRCTSSCRTSPRRQEALAKTWRRARAVRARSSAARAQPDARPPRLPPRHHLPRDHRDAGARDLRGGLRRAAQDGKTSSPRS
jgi:pyruvate,orthophosphate dikinase